MGCGRLNYLEFIVLIVIAIILIPFAGIHSMYIELTDFMRYGIHKREH